MAMHEHLTYAIAKAVEQYYTNTHDKEKSVILHLALQRSNLNLYPSILHFAHSNHLKK